MFQMFTKNWTRTKTMFHNLIRDGISSVNFDDLTTDSSTVLELLVEMGIQKIQRDQFHLLMGNFLQLISFCVLKKE